jgi:predicted nucleic acid-binding protein
MVVLDANILIRAVLGRRVREILETHFTKLRFFAPDTAFREAREHLPKLLEKRGINPEVAIPVLDELSALIGCVDDEIYGPFETAARQRLQRRDEEDWPVLATALALDVRSGRKTQTSSERAWRHGPRIALSFCFESCNSAPPNRVPNKGPSRWLPLRTATTSAV